MYCIEDRRDEIIKVNIGLVHSCANKFRGRGIDYEDLFQAGCMGLVKAVDAFDETRGVRLSTYAVPVILGEIRRLFRDGGTVKVSRSLKELSLRLSREKEYLSVSLGREPTIAELAEHSGVPEEQVVEALTAMLPTVSLTSTDEEGTVQLDIPTDSVEEEIGETLSLKEVIDMLEPGDKQLITLRYFGGKTQMETAQMLGMTQVQVSRREKKILVMLRDKLTG